MATMSGRIEGQQDFELGIPRTVPVTFTAETPEDGPADGLVFLIPGFGGDKDESFSRWYGGILLPNITLWLFLFALIAMSADPVNPLMECRLALKLILTLLLRRSDRFCCKATRLRGSRLLIAPRCLAF